MNQCRCGIYNTYTVKKAESCSKENTPVMAFVPCQKDVSMYNESQAFCRGSLFAALDKPFKGKGGCCCD